MKVDVILTIGVLIILGGCGATLKPAEFSAIEYLVVSAPVADNIPVASLREAAIRQATAGCKQSHQAFKLIDGDAGSPPNTSFTDQELAVRQLKDADARRFSSVGISFRCIGASTPS